MRMETTVTDIDLDRRTVTARNTHEGFDKLILCTGFVWEKPGVPGDNLPGLHYVKDIRAAMEFDKELDSMKKIVVYGGTPIGVEMAGNLGHRGLEVEFVDEGPWALSELLDPDVAEPVHESLRNRGVNLHFGTKVEAFIGGENDRVRAVKTSAGEFECDRAGKGSCNADDQETISVTKPFGPGRFSPCTIRRPTEQVGDPISHHLPVRRSPQGEGGSTIISFSLRMEV